jgi:hypothetical protein
VRGQTMPASASFFAKESRRTVSWMATGSVDGSGMGVGVGVVWAHSEVAVRVKAARMEMACFMGAVVGDFVLHDTTGLPGGSRFLFCWLWNGRADGLVG